MQQQQIQFLTPALWQKQRSPGLLIPTSEALARFLRNTETGSLPRLILVATSHTISTSRAGCDIPLSGPPHLSSAQDGRAVPKLKGVSSSPTGYSECSAPAPALSLLQGSGFYSSDSVATQQLIWRCLGLCSLCFSHLPFPKSAEAGAASFCASLLCWICH